MKRKDNVHFRTWNNKAGVLVHKCNPSAQKAKAGRLLQVQDQPGLQCETVISENQGWSGVMAQWVTSSPYKHEDLNLPRTLHKNAGGELIIPILGRKRQVDAWNVLPNLFGEF